MHQSARDLLHLIGIEILGTHFEKIDKFDFRHRHAYIHTYQSDVIRPPSGVQLVAFQALLIIFLIEYAISRISGVPEPSQHFPNLQE